MSESYDSMQAWLASRPECVQKLAAEFPLGTVVDWDGVDFYLLGYTEDDKLIVSVINPTDDYERALSERTYICAEHLRNATLA